jgi:hypothetical protein
MKFKHEKDKELFLTLHPILIMMFSDMYYYAQLRHGVDLVVTDTVSTISEDIRLGRKSSSHRERRALDIRTKDIDVFIINDILEYINNKPEYKRYHYERQSGGRIFAYLHTHKGEHIHAAIHSQYALK